MKKLISLTLALLLVFSLATVASATESKDVTGNNPGNASVAGNTVTIKKNYTAVGDTASSPAETFTMTIESGSVTNGGIDPDTNQVVVKSPDATISSVTYSVGDAGEEGKAIKNITVTLPAYKAVGIYSYTIKETPGITAGVDYFDGEITLIVTVIQGTDGQLVYGAVHCENPVVTVPAGTTNTNKKDTFENTYSAGTLAVTKEVTGDFGDLDKDFNVTVTFNAPQGKNVNSDITYYVDGVKQTIAGNGWSSKEVEISLKHEETITFENIPYGVTYTVVEDDYTGENGGYDSPVYAYSDTAETKTINEAGPVDTVEITNNKGGTIDTGITLDSIPFILILAVCAGAVVLFVVKRRRSVDF